MMNRVAILLLRIVLLIGALIAVLSQVIVLPALSLEVARQSPEYAYLRVPILVGSIVWLACIEVVLFATWRLLGAVAASRIFARASLRWVNWIIAAMGAATVITAVGFAFDAASWGGPVVIPAALLTALLVLLALLLMMIVMRALLRQATDMRTEMDAVI